MAEGVEDERQKLLERVSMLAEKTWNVHTTAPYAELEPVADALREKFSGL